jgi:type IV secretion system protein VirB11
LKAWNTGHTGNITTIHADNCASMLVRMEYLLREEIKGTIPRISAAIHLCVHLTATPKGPMVDEVRPTSQMVQEDRIDFLRGGGEG